MREIVTATTARMVGPSLAARATAAAAFGSAAAHDRYLRDWPCLTQIELCQATAGPDRPERMTVAAWNIERCKCVGQSAERLRQAGTDLLLATEMDLGMARSGQMHTPRDLAAELGMGYAFGVEFVELGVGDARETRDHGTQSNAQGLHGNAILSRFPIEDPALIPIDDGGAWFVQAPKGDGQHRVGGRMALAAKVAGIVFAAVHFESESTPAERAAQATRLLSGLQAQYGTGPAVIGGDLNTKRFEAAHPAAFRLPEDPGALEPAIACFADHGFDWRSANALQVTTRPHPEDPADKPRWMLDWLLTRDVGATAPQVHPALDTAGAYLSDHELITAEIRP